MGQHAQPAEMPRDLTCHAEIELRSPVTGTSSQVWQTVGLAISGHATCAPMQDARQLTKGRLGQSHAPSQWKRCRQQGRRWAISASDRHPSHPRNDGVEGIGGRPRARDSLHVSGRSCSSYQQQTRCPQSGVACRTVHARGRIPPAGGCVARAFIGRPRDSDWRSRKGALSSRRHHGRRWSVCPAPPPLDVTKPPLRRGDSRDAAKGLQEWTGPETLLGDSRATLRRGRPRDHLTARYRRGSCLNDVTATDSKV